MKLSMEEYNLSNIRAKYANLNNRDFIIMSL